MLLSRRVKKGPGRRPQSAKRQKFLELRERGWSIRAAAREVGVSRSSATNWATGFNVYRNGKFVRFVPPLDRLLARQIHARFLSQHERVQIADLRLNGVSVREIAQKMRRAPSTISRELRRNAGVRCNYQPFAAHRQATARRARLRLRRLETNVELRQVTRDLLHQRWKPQQISRQLRLLFPGSPEMRLCHQSI